MKILNIIGKIFRLLFYLFLLAVFIFVALHIEYIKPDDHGNSEIADLLPIFVFNRSKHLKDPVPSCWYYDGDFTVHIQKNSEALYYLSLAYKEAKGEGIKRDLLNVINQQLLCVEQMLDDGYKQFRDKDNKGYYLPPNLNEYIYPQKNYKLEEGEGLDVYLFLNLVYKNLSLNEKAINILKGTEKFNKATEPKNCCENLSTYNENELNAIKGLVGFNYQIDTSKPSDFFYSILSFTNGNYTVIKNYLDEVELEFSLDGKPYNYFGGNYDIAQTIVLERLYNKSTGDDTYKPLSNKLMSYLRGNNEYEIDFAHYPNPNHPCGLTKLCSLKTTLISGVDENTKNNPNGNNGQGINETQITGQAKFILAYILLNDL